MKVMKVQQSATLRHVFLPALVIAVIVGFTAYADDVHGSGRSIEEILQEIRERESLGQDDRINPAAVDEALLEELGETVMGLMVPNSRRHEWMDRMMGGEGSESLAEHHRWMGYRYLSGGWGAMGPMMGFSPLNRGAPRGFGTMGYGHGGPVVWIAITVLIAALIVLSILLINTRRRSSAADVFEIVKRRFARGEISREEYDRLRRDLR